MHVTPWRRHARKVTAGHYYHFTSCTAILNVPEVWPKTALPGAAMVGVPPRVRLPAIRHVGCPTKTMTKARVSPHPAGPRSQQVPGHVSLGLFPCAPLSGEPVGTRWTQEAEWKGKCFFTECWGSRPVQLPAGCPQLRTWSSAGARSRGRTGRWWWRHAGRWPGTAASVQDRGEGVSARVPL